MLNRKYIILVMSLISLPVSQVQAYPEAAHGIMAGLAFDKSVLADEEFIRSLGIVDENRITNLTDSKGTPYQVTPYRLQNLRRLVSFGAVREDALAPPRMLNHFFDVQNGGGPYADLGAWNITAPNSSLDWSLELNGDITNWALLSDQDLSYKDALEYYVDGVRAVDPFIRDSKMGLVFQIMGHLTHHVQDMAQPEHTRGDNHFDTGSTFVNDLFTPQFVTASSPSLFETTVASDLAMITRAQAQDPYVSVDIREFSEPAEFWSKGSINSLSNKGIAAFSSRNYISQDTNYSFQDNQIFNGITVEVDPASTQPLPAGGPLAINAIPGTFVSAYFPGSHYLFTQRYYAGHPVVDHYDGSKSFYNDLVTNLNLAVLADASSVGALGIDTVTVQKQVDTLVPRAISYSTAMIDFFFRGRLSLVEISPSTSTTGVITLRNDSGKQYVNDGNGGPLALNNGNFRVFAEDSIGRREEITVTVSSTSIAYQEEFELNYDLSVLNNQGNIEPRQVVKFVVLYEGDIGQYEAVASVEVPRLGTLLLTDAIPLIATGKQLAKEGAYTDIVWNSRNSVMEQYNIDWKGRYITDASTGLVRPSRTVSISGPEARFFGSEGYTNNILVDGRFLYLAPFPVLGAAMRTDANGDEYVLAVVHDYATQTEKIIRKRYLTVSNSSKKIVAIGSGGVSPTSGLSDWELLSDIPFGIDYPNVDGEKIVAPWFFNGDGTEASTLREKRITRFYESNRCGDQTVWTCGDPNSGYSAGDYEVSVLNRYQLSITDTSASATNIGYEVGDKAELGLDYLDDELLILNTRNIPYTTLAQNSNWLFVNDEPLLDRSIYDCEHQLGTGSNKFACRPVADTALAPTGFPGLHTRWVGTPDGSFNGLTTSLHLSYIDLRTKTFEYTKAITKDVLNVGADARVEYWISHNGQKQLLKEIDNGSLDCYDDNFLYMSPYGLPAFPANYFDLEPIPPVRGQYTVLSSCATIAPLNQRMVRGVDRYSTMFSGGQNGSDNSWYNYISTGDSLSQFNIFNTDSATPTKVIVR